MALTTKHKIKCIAAMAWGVVICIEIHGNTFLMQYVLQQIHIYKTVVQNKRERV